MISMIKHLLKLILYFIIISFILFVLLEHTTGNPAIQYLHEHGVAQITDERIKICLLYTSDAADDTINV